LWLLTKVVFLSRAGDFVHTLTLSTGDDTLESV